MGNATSLLIAAMSRVMHLNQTDVLRLRSRLLELSWIGTELNSTVSHNDFRQALKDVRITNEYDTQILNLIFIMIDKNGTSRVDPMEFLVGISPLAIIANPADTLKFALDVRNVRGDGRIRRLDVLGSLKSK